MDYMSVQMDSQIEGAISENERLVRENEALRKDAERYRWLRENGRGDLDILWVYQGEELDRLIDSEISREKGANP